MRPAEVAFPCLLPGRPYIEDVMPRHESLLTDLAAAIKAPPVTHADFAIGEVVRHRLFDFRGVVFDIDPVFANSDDWYEAIPQDLRPRRDQPFYHILAENEDSSYVAYVSQQNLLEDADGGPIDHPSVPELFEDFTEGRYRLRRSLTH